MIEHAWGEGSELTGVTRTLQRGLPAVSLETPLASALVYLQGAHVAHFQPAGEAKVLWMSEHALYAPGKALRGGVPICFPWFGNHPERKELPAHGFARTRPWRYLGSASSPAGAARLSFELTDDPETRTLWPHAFRAELRVSVGRELELALSVTASDAGFSYEQALHSYFAVSDVQNCRIEGLSGASYFDKVAGESRRESAPALLIAGETDRVYESDAACLVHDPGPARRTLRVDKSGSQATVIWNPWRDKAQKMSDFGDDEWPRMLCVESASVGASRIRLDAGETHTLVQRVSLTK